MKLLIWILLILVTAVAISLVGGSQNGYVLIVQPPYRIEISLNLFIIALALGFLSLHGLLRLVQYTLRLPDSVQRFKLNQRRKRAEEALQQGLHELAAGHYAAAEKAAARALKLGGDGGLGALTAAEAAHRLGHAAQRDFYLAEAARLAPDAAVARLLLQAELQLEQQQYTLALEALHALEQVEPQLPAALELQLKVYQQLRNWEKVLQLLGALEKQQKTTPAGAALERRRQLRLHAHQQMLERRAGNAQELAGYWKKIAREDQLATPLAQAAARLLAAAGDGDGAAQIIEASLQQQWDSALAAQYGDCGGQDTLRQLEQAERWLQQHHNDAGLLLALGSLCMRQELWGKAQSYLEASLSVREDGRAHLALARLLERNGELSAANRHYRLSLEHALR